MPRSISAFFKGFSSPYKTSDYETTPHAHFEIKQLIEKYTQNNVYVEIRDDGIDGVGSSLASSVKYGLTDCALLSVSNLSPMIPELDIINIPFWSASPENYMRLFSSDVWQRHILSKLDKHNYFYQICKARPHIIPWELTAKTARVGRFEALAPSITGLYSGPDGLRNEIGIISEIESVHDG